MGDVLSMEHKLEAVKQERIAKLRQEIDYIKRKILDVALESGQYAIGTDGSVHYQEGELELNESQREPIIGANIRLKEIYQELKALGFEPNAKS